jgi:hypothetical protein
MPLFVENNFLIFGKFQETVTSPGTQIPLEEGGWQLSRGGSLCVLVRSKNLNNNLLDSKPPVPQNAINTLERLRHEDPFDFHRRS